MILFKEKMSFADPFNVIFLCGSKYIPESGKDKRVILKKFLLDSNINCQTVLLEENFVFAKNKKGYLAYDNIFVKNLSEVESLAALYAYKIIIIHETLSTAAEIGMFAGNKSLTSKICILFPDDISIEENKISAFIKLAFFNNNDTKNDKPNRIKYYPDIEIHRSSVNKSEYHTFLHENKIGDVLGQKVLKYVKKEKSYRKIEIKRRRFDKAFSDPDVISYAVFEKDKKVGVSIYADALKIQLLSMFTVESFRSEFRKEKPIKDHVTYIEDNYRKILLDTICNIAGINSNKYSLSVELVGINGCNLRQAIGYFIYMLQATELIGLEQLSEEDFNKRKIRIKEQMESCISDFNDYIYKKPETVFGGIMS